MSEATQTNEQDAGTDEGQAQAESENMKQLREAASRGTQAQRELAWLKAGYDTDDPLVATVMTTYKGELTKDAVQEFAKGLGLEPRSTTTEPTPGPDEDERRRQETIDAHQQRELLRDANDPNDGTDQGSPDPHVRGLEGFREALAEGFTREEAAGEYIGSVIQAKKEGDPRATWTGWEGDDAVRAQVR